MEDLDTRVFDLNAAHFKPLLYDSSVYLLGIQRPAGDTTTVVAWFITFFQFNDEKLRKRYVKVRLPEEKMLAKLSHIIKELDYTHTWTTKKGDTYPFMLLLFSDPTYPDGEPMIPKAVYHKEVPDEVIDRITVEGRPEHIIDSYLNKEIIPHMAENGEITYIQKPLDNERKYITYEI